MAKELPYFKFEPSEWDNGNIQLCSFEAQGIFINLCSMYWQRLGDMPYKLALVKICRGNDKNLKVLIGNGVIKQSDEFIKIDFLDTQLEEFKIISSKRSEAGKKGGDNRVLAPETARIKGNQIYVIHCFDEHEEFIKVGITSESISRRFSGKMPYQYNILFQFSTDVYLNLEHDCNELLYRKYGYKPNIEFVGYLECFSMSVLSELNEIIKHRTGNDIAMPKHRLTIIGEEIRGEKKKEENRKEERAPAIERNFDWFKKQIDEVWTDQLPSDKKNKLGAAIENAWAFLSTDSHRLKIIDSSGCKKLVNNAFEFIKVGINGKLNGNKKQQHTDDLIRAHAARWGSDATQG